ncbi:MAG: NAD-dependent epimerase/dehydratase family protein [Bacteroidales bacterium]|nr:NAD-dependent epimerase/dehydratase family protein [Bacteroidales bacterium]
MKIFITGATGFIGTQVVNRLMKTKHELTCLVRKNNETSERLRTFGAKLALGDITDKNSVLQGMKGCDWVLNLAALYSFWERNNRLYHDLNIDGTRNVMECVLETGISKVVHVSSMVTFGKPADMPFTEESQIGPVRLSRYAQTKFEGDLIVWNLYKNKKLPVVMVYPGAVLGAGDPKSTGKYVTDLINKKLPATVFKESALTWVHVNDVAEIIVRAAENQGNIGEKYLAGKSQLLMAEINKIIHDISGVSIPFLHMPDFLAMASAYMFTGLSRITGISPPWGMSVDQMRTMKEGFRGDGSKAEKELGITYTPVRTAIEEEIAAMKG